MTLEQWGIVAAIVGPSVAWFIRLERRLSRLIPREEHRTVAEAIVDIASNVRSVKEKQDSMEQTQSENRGILESVRREFTEKTDNLAEKIETQGREVSQMMGASQSLNHVVDQFVKNAVEVQEARRKRRTT